MAVKRTKKLVKTAPDNLELSFEQTYIRIRDILSAAKERALKAIDNEMIRAAWQTGHEIIEQEQRGIERAKYGAQVIQTLSKRLSQELGKGYTSTNLWYMRQFYSTFPNLHALRGELSWTHYRMVLSIKDEQARDFYITESAKANWSTRQLNRQINSLLFERLAKSRDKQGVLNLANEGMEVFTPSDLIRDPFVLEFTGLPERGQWLENDLEQALMDKLQQFLLELGRDFFFVARQKRITVHSEHNYVDLVFYHRTLRCFVLIDLKIGTLTSADVGQMLGYIGYFEAHETRPDENPPVGLILCTDTETSFARYALRKSEEKIFAARYQLYLPTEAELQAELERERNDFLLQRRLSKGDADV
jgi:predicted nuclease of restriction endonuclease-like (RecB) superfamily